MDATIAPDLAMPAPTIDDDDLRRLVEAFYTQVREDALLGPVFATQRSNEWPIHLARMTDFWSNAMLGTGRYQGQPAAKHAALSGVQPAHFARWLTLFEATAHDQLPPEDARRITTVAQRMSVGLERITGVTATAHPPLPTTG